MCRVVSPEEGAPALIGGEQVEVGRFPTLFVNAICLATNCRATISPESHFAPSTMSFPPRPIGSPRLPVANVQLTSSIRRTRERARLASVLMSSVWMRTHLVLALSPRINPFVGEGELALIGLQFFERLSGKRRDGAGNSHD